jgi:hypothetical protein
MRRFTLPAALTLAALVLAAGPAAAVVTDFNVSGVGTFVSPATATISGSAKCDGGSGTITFANSAAKPPPPAVDGTVVVACDGTSHPWAATISGGPFAPRQTLLFGGTLAAPSGTINHPVLEVVLR